MLRTLLEFLLLVGQVLEVSLCVWYNLGKSLGLEPQTPGEAGPAHSAEDAGREGWSPGWVGKKG